MGYSRNQVHHPTSPLPHHPASPLPDTPIPTPCEHSLVFFCWLIFALCTFIFALALSSLNFVLCLFAPCMPMPLHSSLTRPINTHSYTLSTHSINPPVHHLPSDRTNASTASGTPFALFSPLIQLPGQTWSKAKGLVSTTTNVVGV